MLNAPARELLAAIVDSSDDGIVSKTLQGIITSWNPAAQRIFGYSPEEAVGRSILMLFPPDRLGEEDHFLSEIAAGRHVEHFQTVRIRKDGQAIPVAVTLSPIRDAQGIIVGASKIVRDISEQARLERRVAQASAELERILSTVGEGVIALDRELRYIFANDAAIQLMGLSRDAMIGRTPQELFPGEVAAEAVPKMRAALGGSEGVRYEGYHPGADRWFENRLYPSPDGLTIFFTDITARRRAEEALRKSRDVLSLAMRGGRMGAWSRDLITNEVWWSRELEELFGLPPGGFEGTHPGFRDLVHDDDRERLDSAVVGAVESGTDYVVEFRFRHASGEWRWMEGRGRAVNGDDGVPVSLYGIGIDVTERKVFESALAAARDAADSDAERLNLALAAARLGAWMWDTATDLVTLSPRAAEIFGVPAGEAMTWTAMRALLHPDDRDRARRAVIDAIQTRTDYAIEYRLVNEGRERWVSASGRARYDTHGQVTTMFGVVEDITRDRLLVSVDDAVRRLTDPETITFTAARILGEHLDVNRCAYASVEEDEDAFILTGNYTAGAQSIVGRYRFRQFGAECLRLVRAGQPWVVTDSETDARLEPDDRPAYRLTAVRAVICVPIMKGDQLVAAMAVHTTTPRAWRSDEVTLLQQVASRCWESIERARVEAERAGLLEAAESANRAKDEFMAMLGHELRNPLSPILTALQLMKLRGDAGFDRERTVIERQVTHLTRLVDDLLDVSRIARGKVELRLARVELSAVVGSAIEIASPLLEEKAHQLAVDVPEEGLLVHGDAGRLSQVVSNLLTNAAKYTPDAGRVSVEAAAVDGHIELRVRDNGIGIAPDALAQVFDLFVQGRQATDRAQGGLGLGLTIVKNLVERHGGTVAAFSDGPGRGSEFVVRLPRAKAAEAPADEARITPARRARNGLTRLLVVDDNPDAAEMIAEALLVNNYVVRVAHDGPEALRIAEEFRPDAAFLDLGLPVMDGYELATRLREIPGLARIRLFAVTGYGQPSDRERTAGAGFMHHLVKPVDLDALVALLEVNP